MNQVFDAPSLLQMQEPEFAQEIIKARQLMKISQAQLATKLGISTRTLESWERGKRHPSRPSQALIRLFIKSPEFVLNNLG
ncbi:helix-turn-helix domain-containing protein [bacterium SPL81]|nr:helix-turn-helix domain-containing protein [Acinetobacter baumannii]